MQRLMIQSITLVVYQGSIENDLFRETQRTSTKKGLTQQEIADLVHVNRVTYTNWERGKREPSFENLVNLADLLEVSLDSLFGRE